MTYEADDQARLTGKRSANGRPDAAYLALIGQFPLRTMRSERDYDAAASVLDTMAVGRKDRWMAANRIISTR